MFYCNDKNHWQTSNRNIKLNPIWSTTCLNNQSWKLWWPNLKRKLPHLPSLLWLTESPSYYNFSSYQFHLKSLFCVIVFSNLSFSSFYKVKLYDLFKCHKFRIIHLLDSINVKWINAIIKFVQLINVIHYPSHPLVATPPITTTRGPFDFIFFVKTTNRILIWTIFSSHSSKPTLPYLGGTLRFHVCKNNLLEQCLWPSLDHPRIHIRHHCIAPCHSDVWFQTLTTSSHYTCRSNIWNPFC
jgi:hypothetical protein